MFRKDNFENITLIAIVDNNYHDYWSNFNLVIVFHFECFVLIWLMNLIEVVPRVN